MGFLTKKNLLVSLLALSLAACETPPTKPPPKPIKDTTTIDLPCSGDPSPQDVAKKIKFEITDSACTLDDVNFIKDTNGNSGHFTKTKKATSADPTVEFSYNGSSPPVGDAPFYYTFHTPKTAGGGGGVIH